MKIDIRKIFGLTLLLALSLTTVGCGGGGGGDDDEVLRMVGQIFLPPQVTGTNAPVASANAPIQVLDVTRSADQQVVLTSSTDANGSFDVSVTRSELVAIISMGTVRVAGLISPETSSKDLSIGKNFNGVTDIACEAGLTIVAQGAASGEDFDQTRIAILEEGAAFVLSTDNVNFKDPASVTAAAAKVRLLTQDGTVRVTDHSS